MRNLLYKSIDTMKKTKDKVDNQILTSEIDDLIQCIVNGFRPTHIAISQPFDSDADFRSHGKVPSPLSAEAHYQYWTDKIHSYNVGVLHRGTWCGIEGIYSFPYNKSVVISGVETSSTFIPQGTVASAPTDGNSTWLGKNYKFIIDHPQYFANGDIWAPIPEATGQAFAGNFFISSIGGTTANYTTFFSNLKTSSDQAFAAIGKPGVLTGFTCNNYSEVRTGYIPQSMFNTVNLNSFDYYGDYDATGDRSPEKYRSDVKTIYSSKQNKPLFWQEWADNRSNLTLDYFNRMMKMMTELANEGKLIGFNYWGGFDGDSVSLLYKDGNGKYQLNAKGKILAAYWQQGFLERLPRVSSSTGY